MAAFMNVLGEAAMRRERVFRDRSNPLDMYDDIEMFKKYRFRREGAMFIIDLIEESLQPATQRSQALPASLQVFIALHFYATGSVLDDPASLHGCSIATCSRVIRKVTLAICAKKDQVSYSYS